MNMKDLIRLSGIEKFMFMKSSTSEERHQDYEKHITSGSTYKGCGAVQREKIMRQS